MHYYERLNESDYFVLYYERLNESDYFVLFFRSGVA